MSRSRVILGVGTAWAIGVLTMAVVPMLPVSQPVQAIVMGLVGIIGMVVAQAIAGSFDQGGHR